jgi:modification methylase
MKGVLDELGWIQSVIVNRTTGNVIDGHLRIEEAIENNETSIPVAYVELTEVEEKKAILVYDPIGTLARQNKEKLEELVKSVAMDSASAQDMVRAMAKKNKIDIAKYKDTGDEEMNNVTVISENDGEYEEFDVQDGDIFDIRNEALNITHRLMCGDNRNPTNYKRLLGGIKPVLCVTSPPYNQNINKFKPSGMQKENTAFVDRMSDSYKDDMNEDEYQKSQIEMINLIGSFMAPNGSIFYNHKIRYRDKKVVTPYEWISKSNYNLRQEIIWDRGGSVTLNAKMFIPCEERIYWIRIGDNFIFNDETEIKSWSNIWRFGAKNDVKVSAAFPYELPYRCIIACSNPKDAVFDPYCGSGTTIVAANRSNRVGFGIEISPEYVLVSLKRFEREGMTVRKVAHD